MTHAHAAARKCIKSVTELNMQIFSSPWLIVAVVCLLGLATYAALLWRRVGLAEQQRQQQHAKQKAQRHDDLIILAEGLADNMHNQHDLKSNRVFCITTPPYIQLNIMI